MENSYIGAGTSVSGEKVHKIDSKDRIAIPANMRPFLTSDFVISRGFGDYISLMPRYVYNSYLAKISNSPLKTTRKEYILRQLCSATEDGSLDAQGRVTLSAKLKKYAGIENDDQALIIGNYNHIEIRKYIPEDEEEFVDLAALMDEVDSSYDINLIG